MITMMNIRPLRVMVVAMMIAVSIFTPLHVLAMESDDEWSLMADGKYFAVYCDLDGLASETNEFGSIVLREKWVPKGEEIESMQELFSAFNFPAYAIRTSRVNILTHSSSIESFEIYGTRELIGRIDSEALLAFRAFIPDGLTDDVAGIVKDALIDYLRMQGLPL